MSLKSIGLLECLALSRRQGVNAGQYSAVRPKCDDEVYGTKFKKKGHKHKPAAFFKGERLITS